MKVLPGGTFATGQKGIGMDGHRVPLGFCSEFLRARRDVFGHRRGCCMRSAVTRCLHHRSILSYFGSCSAMASRWYRLVPKR